MEVFTKIVCVKRNEGNKWIKTSSLQKDPKLASFTESVSIKTVRCYGKKRHSVFKTTEEMLKEIVTYAKVASTTKTQSVINAEIDQITKQFSYLTYFALNTVADPGEGLLLSFRPNWGPKGGKKIWETAPPPPHPPPLYLSGSGWPGPFLISRSRSGTQT